MHTFIVNNAVARVLHITTKQSINTQKIPICRRGWACSSLKNKGQNQFINQHTNKHKKIPPASRFLKDRGVGERNKFNVIIKSGVKLKDLMSQRSTLGCRHCRPFFPPHPLTPKNFEWGLFFVLYTC